MRIEVVTRRWWAFALRGVIAILFGVLAIFFPLISATVLVLLFGAYALADGVFTIFAAVARRGTHHRWGALLLGGLVGVVAGIVTFLWPAITAFAFIYLMAAWALLLGAAEIIAAIRLRKHVTGEWALVLAGGVSIVFGFLLFAYPAAGVLALGLWIGLYAIFAGAMFLALAFRLRGLIGEGRPIMA